MRTAIVLLLFMLQACRPSDESMSSNGAGETVDTRPTEWVVFSSARTGNGDIYGIDPTSGEAVLLMGSDAPEGAVRYDPARKRIVYHRYEEDPARAVLVANGEGLFEDPNGDVAPSWSPKGTHLVYAAVRNGRENLYVSAPDGSEEVRLTEGEWVDRYPAWSPDGNQIVFAREREIGWDLYSLTVFPELGAALRITDDGAYFGHPSWSPDGRFIAFDTLIEGQAEIAIIELSTGQVTRLTERAGNDLIPAWSLDSRRVLFGGEPDGSGNWDLWEVDRSTLEMKRLTDHAGFDGGPVVVPAEVIEQMQRQ